MTSPLTILRNAILLLPLACFLLIAGCLSKDQAGVGDYFLNVSRQMDGAATISVFLEVMEDGGPHIWMQISNLQVKTGDRWLPLALAHDELSSRNIEENGQVIMGRGEEPSGGYDRLRFTIDKAALGRNGQRVFLALPEPVVEIPIDKQFSLSEGDSISLFLTWDVKASLRGKANLVPLMDAEIQSVPLITNLAYISCPKINTIYIVRTDHNRVCGSIGIEGGPTCIELRPGLNRLYVLSPDDPSIRIFELTSNKQLDRIRIPFSNDTAYMAVGPDGHWAYVLDEGTNRLLRLDLFNGALESRISVSARPHYILYAEDKDLFAVSSAYGQEISLIEPGDSRIIRKITTDGSPAGLLIHDDELYVAENSTGTVIIYDLDINKVKSRIRVGRGPNRLIENNNHIYVTNTEGRSISVLLPKQLNVFREIRLRGKPFEMAVSAPYQWLYAGDVENGGVYLIDMSSNQVVKKIETGAIPYDIDVID